MIEEVDENPGMGNNDTANTENYNCNQEVVI